MLAQPKISQKDLKYTVLPAIKRGVSSEAYGKIQKLLTAAVSSTMSKSMFESKMKDWKRDPKKLSLTSDDLKKIEDACKSCMKI